MSKVKSQKSKVEGLKFRDGGGLFSYCIRFLQKYVYVGMPCPYRSARCTASNHCYNRGMKRYAILFLLFLGACRRVPPVTMPAVTATFVPATVTALPTLPPTWTPTAIPSPTPTATPLPTATSTVTPTPTPRPGPGLDAAEVHVFPEPLYAGDVLTFDIDPRLPPDAEGVYTLSLVLPDEVSLSAQVVAQGLDGQSQVRFYWAWTLPPEAETLPLTLSLAIPPGVDDPDLTDNALRLSLPVYSTTALLPPEPWAAWAVTETADFRLHYVTHTAAERDLHTLVTDAQAAYADITAQLSADADEVLDIYLLDRIIGQGGYASSGWVVVSYTDRMYAPISLGMVLRHELVHRLDKAIRCQSAPSLMREGLAVYLPGGHYRREPLPRKVAAIVEAQRYISLTALLDNFYVQQHEISYAEAGALISYVVDTYTWAGLEALCEAASTATGNDAERFAEALATLDIADLSRLEADWLAWVATKPLWDVGLLDADLQLMETMRAYQLRYNVSAHFLEGILFDVVEAERQGLVADFVRRPRDPEAIALELLLAQAQVLIREGETAAVTPILAAMEATLRSGSFSSPLAADALAITEAALAMGYDPYQLTRQPGGYYVGALDWAAWPTQHTFVARRGEDGWVLTLLCFAE